MNGQAHPVRRTTELVGAWCRWYTRDLPADTARDRCAELHSDLFDQCADGAQQGTSSGQLARSILARAARGVPADLSWRTHQLRIARSAGAKEAPMSSTINGDGWRSTARALSAVVAPWAVVAAVGMGATTDGSAWAAGAMAAFVLGLALALYGVWAMPRHPRAGALASAVAAVLTTVPLIWFVVIPMLGVAIAAFFVVFAVRERRILPAAPA